MRYVILLFMLIEISMTAAKVPDRSWRDLKAQRQAQTLVEYVRNKSSLTSVSQDNYDVNWYGLEFSFNISAKIIYGIVEMEYTITQDNTNTISIDMLNNLILDSISGNITSYVRENSNRLLTITLDKIYNSGQTASVRIVYHGNPQTGGFGAFGIDNSASGGTLIWSLSEPYYSSSWWPCKDTPGDKADSADIYITVPTGLLVASNGTKIDSVIQSGNVRYHWQVRYPIPPYLISLAISDYKYQETTWSYNGQSMPSVCYYYSTVNDNTAAQCIQTQNQGLTVFSDLFGLYPFINEKYGSAQFNWGGGMEHQTITSLGGHGTYLIIHELAHQWWGDYITCANWHEIWLNEGFASYSEALYVEAVDGRDDFHDYVNQNFRSGLDNRVYVDDTTNVSSIFSSTVYDKGAWVLHMLRYMTGDSVFFAILRTYFQQIPYGVATTEQFRAICENISGQDLQQFFQHWIYSPFRPAFNLSYHVHSQEDTLYQVDLTLTQSERGIVLDMPIPIQLTFSDESDTTVTLFFHTSNVSGSFLVTKEPVEITLDPYNWILKRSVTYTNVQENGGIHLLQHPIVINSIGPNPLQSQGKLRFSLTTPQTLRLEIFNLLGETVYATSEQKYPAGQNQLTWNTATLPGGIYLYQLRSNLSRASGKITIAR